MRHMRSVSGPRVLQASETRILMGAAADNQGNVPTAQPCTTSLRNVLHVKLHAITGGLL